MVKVLIKRRFQEGRAREAFALLNKLRAEAMKQKGYIFGETLFNHDDIQEVLVISVWNSMENWLAWKENPERAANERLLERWLEGHTEYSAYVFGTFAHFSGRKADE